MISPSVITANTNKNATFVIIFTPKIASTKNKNFNNLTIFVTFKHSRFQLTCFARVTFTVNFQIILHRKRMAKMVPTSSPKTGDIANLKKNSFLENEDVIIIKSLKFIFGRNKPYYLSITLIFEYESLMSKSN